MWNQVLVQQGIFSVVSFVAYVKATKVFILICSHIYIYNLMFQNKCKWNKRQSVSSSFYIYWTQHVGQIKMAMTGWMSLLLRCEVFNPVTEIFPFCTNQLWNLKETTSRGFKKKHFTIMITTTATTITVCVWQFGQTFQSTVPRGGRVS